MATTTPNYGWDVPTSTDYVKDGATAIETLGDDIDASLFSITSGKNVGMVLLNTTTFTGQTTVNIDNVFTSTYRNYRMVVTITDTSSNPQVQGQLRSGGTSTVGTAYKYAYTNISTTGTSNTSTQDSGGSFLFNFISSANANQQFILDLTNPQVNTRTNGTLQIAGYDGGAWYARNGAMFHDAVAQFDGISIFTGDTKTITGEVSIYGYRK
jgi:hypothetical protein